MDQTQPWDVIPGFVQGTSLEQHPKPEAGTAAVVKESAVTSQIWQ